MAGVGRIQPDAPRLPRTALETLEARPDYVEPMLSKWGMPALGSLIGFASVAFYNRVTRRPYLSGVHLYPLSTLGLGYVVYKIQKFREAQWAEKDAILRHYIQLHPDDFPPFVEKTYGEIFEPWYPLR